MKNRSHLFAAAIAIVLLGGCGDVLPTAQSADALDMTQLNPGHTLELGGATLGELPCVRWLGTCTTDLRGFGVRTVAGIVPFARGRGGVTRSYEFEVASGSGNGNVLMGQVCGSASMNGFLALVGGGQVWATLKLKVLDLGPAYARDPQPCVIYSETLADYSLEGKLLSAGLGAGLSGELGSTVTAGLSADFHIEVEIQKEVIRDDIDFGFQVLLKRGHRYRVQCEIEAESKIDALTGLAIAQFMEGGPILNLMLPANWRETVRTLLDPDFVPPFEPKELISNLIAPVISLKPRNIHKETLLGSIEQVLVGGTGSLSSWQTKFPKPFENTHKLLNDLGVPTNVDEVLDIVLDRIRQKVGENVEELLENPGADVKRLTVTLQNDNTELLEAIHHELTR